MSNQSTQYVRKCKDCQGEILMKNIGDRWAALEKDGSTQHRCKKTEVQVQPSSTTNHKVGIVTGGNESKSIETVPAPVPTQKTELAATRTNEDEIVALKTRMSRLERTIKSMVEVYQSQ
jgi:Iap family predicted aminopeptidase